MDTTLAKIAKEIEFTTVSYTAFSSLHAENQVAIASRLHVLKAHFQEWLITGEVKELKLSNKEKIYTFDYRYLKVVFCFDSQNNVQVLDIINKTWLQEQNINRVA